MQDWVRGIDLLFYLKQPEHWKYMKQLFAATGQEVIQDYDP